MQCWLFWKWKGMWRYGDSYVVWHQFCVGNYQNHYMLSWNVSPYITYHKTTRQREHYEKTRNLHRYPYDIENCILFSFLDNNECTLLTHNCHNNAKCLNTKGSFTCSCNTGHSGNGTKCEGRWMQISSWRILSSKL